jgi:hypothetical protein
MVDHQKWVPMQWPSGALEISKGERAGALSAEAAELLRKWHAPSSLSVVANTCVNCLIVSWASGLPVDGEQQETLRPLVEKGRQAGLAFVGLVENGADLKAAIGCARDVGLSAVAADAEQPPGSDFPVIPWTTSEKAKWNSSATIVALKDSVWPCVPVERSPYGGPTGLPWVDSNSALIRMARVLAPSKAIWLTFPPAKDPRLLERDSYARAVADSAVYGAHWVISLDDGLRMGLTANNPQAVETWKTLTKTLGYFEEQKEILTFQPKALLALISDFSGANRSIAYEMMNLLPRRRVQFRVIEKSRALSASLAGMMAAFYADEEGPAATLRKKLLSFASGGGTLFASAKSGFTEGTPVAAKAPFLFAVRSFGKGRIAVLREEQPDPYEVAADTQAVMGHGNDLMRFHNAQGMNGYYTAAVGGKEALIHVLNYSKRVGMPSGLYVRDKYRTAHYLSPEAASPSELKVIGRENGGTDIPLPSISFYGSVKLSQVKEEEKSL